MKPAWILAVDPGLSGALAWYQPDDGLLDVIDVPTFNVVRNGKSKRELDGYKLANEIDQRASLTKIAVVELVGARPKEAPQAAFTFGITTGEIRGMIRAHLIPMEVVSPAIWKKYMGAKADKDETRRRASALLPQYASLWPLVKHDGRAEAALLALYAAKYL